MDANLLSKNKPEWWGTRHCPTCNSTSLNVSSEDPFGGGWCVTECADCGRELREDRLEDAGRGLTWEDPEWVKSCEH